MKINLNLLDGVKLLKIYKGRRVKKLGNTVLDVCFELIAYFGFF